MQVSSAVCKVGIVPGYHVGEMVQFPDLRRYVEMD
jgi:hypothetical protein